MQGFVSLARSFGFRAQDFGLRVEAHYLANAVVIKVTDEEGWSVLREGRTHIVGKPEPAGFRVWCLVFRVWCSPRLVRWSVD
jgi:hypothetical protein